MYQLLTVKCASGKLVTMSDVFVPEDERVEVSPRFMDLVATEDLTVTIDGTLDIKEELR